MNGARSNNDEDTVVVACENLGRVVARRSDGFLGVLGRDNLVPKKGRLDQRVVLRWKFMRAEIEM